MLTTSTGCNMGKTTENWIMFVLIVTLAFVLCLVL